MIIDQLSNARLYTSLHPRFKPAFEFLQTDMLALPMGRTSLDGDHLFALVQEYLPKPLEECRYEAHRKYWDIQYVAQGAERMGWARTAEMTVTEPYSTQRDVAFFQGTGDLILVPAGSFTIFGPHDCHMPMLQPTTTPATVLVRKVVIKVEW